MAVPTTLIYVLGVLFFILAIEEEREVYNLIYVGVSFFMNIIGYFTSYTSTDFTNIAYIPLALIALSVLLFIYRVYGYMPKDTDWGDEQEEKYKFKQDIN